MLRTTTHFKQVPLEIVRQIVEKQAREETSIELDPEIKPNESAARLIRKSAATEHGGQS